MATQKSLKNKQVVLGLGKTGLSCVRFLRRLDCEVVVIDSRAQPPGTAELQAEFPGVPMLTGDFAQFPLHEAEELFVNPGLATNIEPIQAAKRAGVQISGDIELFARSVDKPVIAVTGSNGKSTVVTMLGHALEAAGMTTCVAGNIGVPVLDALLQRGEDVDCWVLELSSFQLETTHSLHCEVAVNLNVSEDHMDRYESLQSYAMAKQRIFSQCEKAIYFLSDRMTHPVTSPSMSMAFGGNEQAHGHFFVNANGDIARGTRVVMVAKDIKLQSAHDRLNLCAVLTSLYALPVELSPQVLSALANFAGLPHRCQWVRAFAGADWYNDSKATNVGAAVAALQGLAAGKARVCWLAGGDGKGADFSQLQTTVAATVQFAILYGRDQQQLAAALAGSVPYTCCDSLAEGVTLALRAVLDPEMSVDIVLLSPACASFDQFSGFEARGEAFIHAVNSLQETE